MKLVKIWLFGNVLYLGLNAAIDIVVKDLILYTIETL